MAFNQAGSRKARKEHRCEWCFETIPVGEIHVQFVGVWDGDFQNWRMHGECYDSAAECLAEGFTPGEGTRPAVVSQ